jgi:hypothetical protein
MSVHLDRRILLKRTRIASVAFWPPVAMEVAPASFVASAGPARALPGALGAVGRSDSLADTGAGGGSPSRRRRERCVTHWQRVVQRHTGESVLPMDGGLLARSPPRSSRPPWLVRSCCCGQGLPQIGRLFAQPLKLFKPPHGDGDRRHEIVPSDRLDEVGQNRIFFRPLGE